MAFSCRIVTTLPVVDVGRARKFYEVKLGLKPLSSTSSGVLYDCGDGTTVFIYEGKPSKAKHVVAAFEVENINEKLTQLRSNGITVKENYMPGIDTLANVATMGLHKAGWFQDSEGNILALVQLGMMLELEVQSNPLT